jgi:hypothetical protein
MAEAIAVMSLGGDYDASRALAFRARMARIAGVNLVEFNYTNNRVTVRFDPDQVGPRELGEFVLREKKHSARSSQASWSSRSRGSNASP